MAKKSRANKRHKIAIEKPDLVADGTGGFNPNPATGGWEIACEPFADIEELRAAESFFAQQIEPSATHRITIRYRAGIQTDYRIRFGARTFAILSFRDPDELNRDLVILAEESPRKVS